MNHLELEFAKRIVRLYDVEDYPVLERYGDPDRQKKPPTTAQVRDILTADLMREALDPADTPFVDALINAALKVIDKNELRDLVSQLLERKAEKLQRELARDWWGE